MHQEKETNSTKYTSTVCIKSKDGVPILEEKNILQIGNKYISDERGQPLIQRDIMVQKYCTVNQTEALKIYRTN